MIFKTPAIAATIALLFGTFPGTNAGAQSAITQPAPNQHHEQLYALMQDMSQEMARMTEDMSHGPLTPEQRKQMSQRMERMSTMMHRMSGFSAKHYMAGDAESQKQMIQMRKQMDEMKRSRAMQAPPHPAPGATHN